jgi:hypothetical protein
VSADLYWWPPRTLNARQSVPFGRPTSRVTIGEGSAVQASMSPSRRLVLAAVPRSIQNDAPVCTREYLTPNMARDVEAFDEGRPGLLAAIAIDRG